MIKHILFLLLMSVIVMAQEIEVPNLEKDYKIEISGVGKDIATKVIDNTAIKNNLFYKYGFLNYNIKHSSIKKIKQEIKEFFKNDGYKDTKVKIIELKSKIIFNIELGSPLIFKNIIIDDKNGYKIQELYS